MSSFYQFAGNLVQSIQCVRNIGKNAEYYENLNRKIPKLHPPFLQIGNSNDFKWAYNWNFCVHDSNGSRGIQVAK